MRAFRCLLCGLGLPATIEAVAFLRTEPDRWARGSQPGYKVRGHVIADSGTHDSKPGDPQLPVWAAPGRGMLFREDVEPWRAALGERLVLAARAPDAMEKCGSFVSFGDYTWCRKAMPRESSPDFKKGFRSVHDYVVDAQDTGVRDTAPEHLMGLSYGIQTTDLWSELMSSLYLVNTKLFDCYYQGTEGPMGRDLHAGHSKQNMCMKRACYTVAYEPHRVCVDDSSGGTERFTAANNRTYEPLGAQLRGRRPLSTFIKMDVEGSEWQSLEWLLENPKEMAKIRTLDMEVHFNKDVTPKGYTMPTQATLTKHVEIIERLAEHFAVTGSTLESFLTEWVRIQAGKQAANPDYHSKLAVLYTAEGLPLEQWCISFVNRKLLH